MSNLSVFEFQSHAVRTVTDERVEPTHYPTRKSRARDEMGWTTGLDLQRAWANRAPCPRRAAPAYIPTNSPHS